MNSYTSVIRIPFFSPPLTPTNCIHSPIFVAYKYKISPALSSLAGRVYGEIDSFMIYPLQLHAMGLAAFAGLIAPFGGFFASGVKRAFKIKDFGDSIPGHGGLTDR